MTNSTDNNNQDQNPQNLGPQVQSNEGEDKKKKKVKKPKGPLRFEAIIPLVIFATLISLYVRIWFDRHLKSLIEYVGTQVAGAEVNVAKLQTDWIKASLLIAGIEVTDKERPTHNTIAIREIRFNAIWDSILRAKVVVEDAGIDGIALNSPRKKPGKVLPPPPPSSGNMGNMMAKVEQQILDYTKEEFAENVLGDLAQVAGGTDPEQILEQIKAELQSEKRIKALQDELKAKELEWKNRIAALPQGEKVKEWEAKAKGLTFKSLDDVKQVSALIKEVKGAIREYENASAQAGKDFKFVEGIGPEVKGLIEKDINDLKKHFQFPQLDAKDFSQKLFERFFKGTLPKLKKYQLLAEKYMPPGLAKGSKKKSAADEVEVIAPKARAQGRNIHFPITTSYPAFWLKRATISSTSTSDQYSGDFKGELTNVTSHPSHVKHPVALRLSGSLPHQKWNGIKLNFSSYLAEEPSSHILEFYVKSFPIEEKVLSKGKNLSLAVKKAEGELSSRISLKGDTVNLKVHQEFKALEYGLDAENKYIKEIVGNILKGIPSIGVDARAEGPLLRPDWNIQSNLGRELANGFKREIQAKIDQAKARLEESIRKRLGPQFSGLLSSSAPIKDGVKNALSGNLAQVNGLKTQLEEKEKSEIDKFKNKIKEDGGKKVKEQLKKLIKF